MFTVQRAIVSRRCLTFIFSGWERNIATLNCNGVLHPSARYLEARQLHPSVLTNSRREYSKAKGRQGSSRHAADRPKVMLSNDELSEVIKVSSFRSGLERALQNLGNSYLKQLSIGNTTGNVESIMVDFENSEVQLCEVAQIQKKPNLVVLQFASFPEAIKPSIKAIEQSGIRASIQQESTTVYLHLPKVTREQREDMAKNAKMLFQKCKDELVKLERGVLKEIQGKKALSEDLIYNAQVQVKYEVQQTVMKAEEMMKSKQNELLKDG